MALPLYVKIKKKYVKLSALAVGPNVKDIQVRTIHSCISYYLKNVTSQKCVKNQKNEASFFNKAEIFLTEKGLVNIDEIKQNHIEELEVLFLKVMKPSSLNRRFNSFRHFFNKCIEWEYIYDNPFKKVKPKKIVENHFKVWPQKDFERFIKTTDGVHRNLLMFLYLTGARPIEAKNLKWTDIDYDNKTVTLECGKNQGGTRSFPLTELVCALLHNMGVDSLHVFSKNKKQIQNINLYHYVKHRLNKLGLNHLVPYGLRHTFASSLNNQDVNAFAIKQLMGHSQIKTTLKYITNSENNLISSLKRANR